MIDARLSIAANLTVALIRAGKPIDTAVSEACVATDDLWERRYPGLRPGAPKLEPVRVEDLPRVFGEDYQRLSGGFASLGLLLFLLASVLVGLGMFVSLAGKRLDAHQLRADVGFSDAPAVDGVKQEHVLHDVKIERSGGDWSLRCRLLLGQCERIAPSRSAQLYGLASHSPLRFQALAQQLGQQRDEPADDGAGQRKPEVFHPLSLSLIRCDLTPRLSLTVPHAP